MCRKTAEMVQARSRGRNFLRLYDNLHIPLSGLCIILNLNHELAYRSVINEFYHSGMILDAWLNCAGLGDDGIFFFGIFDSTFLMIIRNVYCFIECTSQFMNIIIFIYK